MRRVLACAMLLLGLAVFCWGLHDKLSLYAPPTVPPPFAKAKLLSPDEQISSHTLIAVPETPQFVLAALTLLFLAVLTPPLRSFALAVEPPLEPVGRSPSPQLQRRPPPASFLR